MAIWLVRAGKHGELEKKFLEEKRIYLAWEYLNNDLSKISSQEELKKLLAKTYPDDTKQKKLTLNKKTI